MNKYINVSTEICHDGLKIRCDDFIHVYICTCIVVYSL